MPNLVCTGATLQCSFGTTPSSFAASGVQTSASSPAGVVTDVTPENVPPFGLCTTPSNPQVAAAKAPQPCLPVLVAPWTPGSTKVTISGVSDTLTIINWFSGSSYQVGTFQLANGTR